MGMGTYFACLEEGLRAELWRTCSGCMLGSLGTLGVCIAVSDHGTCFARVGGEDRSRCGTIWKKRGTRRRTEMPDED
jgi:hypothetical protein